MLVGDCPEAITFHHGVGARGCGRYRNCLHRRHRGGRGGECIGGRGHDGEQNGAGPQNKRGQSHGQSLRGSRRRAQGEVTAPNSSDNISKEAERRPAPGEPGHPERSMKGQRHRSNEGPGKPKHGEKADRHCCEDQPGKGPVKASTRIPIPHRGTNPSEYEVSGSAPGPERVSEHPASRPERVRGLGPRTDRSPEGHDALTMSSVAPEKVSVASLGVVMS